MQNLELWFQPFKLQGTPKIHAVMGFSCLARNVPCNLSLWCMFQVKGMELRLQKRTASHSFKHLPYLEGQGDSASRYLRSLCVCRGLNSNYYKASWPSKCPEALSLASYSDSLSKSYGNPLPPPTAHPECHIHVCVP